MKLTATHATVAAQPGWFLAIFTNTEGIDSVRCEQIIAWEIQRMTSPNGLVTRYPIPITAESKNTDLDCTIWGVKRPDGKFLFSVRANEGISKEQLSRFARLMETESLVAKLAILRDKSVGQASIIPTIDKSQDTWVRKDSGSTTECAFSLGDAIEQRRKP
jgi:hypothetical protein